MKIVTIGGAGLIGSKTAPILRQKGHEVVAAAPNTGVNTDTSGASARWAVLGWVPSAAEGFDQLDTGAHL